MPGTTGPTPCARERPDEHRVRELLAAAPPKQFEEQVRALAVGLEGVRAVEKCRIRKSGTAYFVELHVEVDGEATVQEGHDIGGRVRSTLRNSPLRINDAFIHIEPHTTCMAPLPSHKSSVTL